MSEDLNNIFEDVLPYLGSIEVNPFRGFLRELHQIEVINSVTHKKSFVAAGLPHTSRT